MREKYRELRYFLQDQKIDIIAVQELKLINRKSELKISTKINLYKAAIVPIALYTSKVWSVASDTQINRIKKKINY